MEISFAVRVVFIGCGLIFGILGLLSWIFREEATYADPASWSLWWSRGPFIEDPDERVAHVKFRSILMLAFSVPALLLGILAPESFFQTINVIGIGALIILSIFLVLLTYADAVERASRGPSSDEELEAEKTREMEESGKLD